MHISLSINAMRFLIDLISIDSSHTRRWMTRRRRARRMRKRSEQTPCRILIQLQQMDNQSSDLNYKMLTMNECPRTPCTPERLRMACLFHKHNSVVYIKPTKWIIMHSAELQATNHTCLIPTYNIYAILQHDEQSKTLQICEGNRVRITH